MHFKHSKYIPYIISVMFTVAFNTTMEKCLATCYCTFKTGLAAAKAAVVTKIPGGGDRVCFGEKDNSV